MQKPEIWKLVLAMMAPSKTDNTYSEWRGYINRYIVPEVRQENVRFYGNIDTREAQHAGLDYALPAHRLRLESFPYHRNLFAVFDRLRLTPQEIYQLCKWHGTKRARDDYERKHSIRILDTTWEGVHPYTYKEPTVTVHENGRRFIRSPRRSRDHVASRLDFEPGPDEHRREDVPYDSQEAFFAEDSDSSSPVTADEEDLVQEDSDDELQQSVGVALNERLTAIAEANAQARARGEEVASMDAEWEQWLKEAAERGLSVPLLPPLTGIPSMTASPNSSAITPRAGYSRTSQLRPLMPPATSSLSPRVDDALSATSAPTRPQAAVSRS